MFQSEFVEKIKTHVLCSVTFPPQNRAVYENVGKYARARQVTGDNVAHALFMLVN